MRIPFLDFCLFRWDGMKTKNEAGRSTHGGTDRGSSQRALHKQTMSNEAIRVKAVLAFVLGNIVVSSALQLAPRKLILPCFLALFVIGTLPKFIGAMAVPGFSGGKSPDLPRSTPSPVGQESPAFRVHDPESKARIVAVIPIFREEKEELLEGIESFWLSELPFPRDQVHVIFVVDGVHARSGERDAVQARTVFALMSALFPAHEFAQSPLDGGFSFCDRTPPPELHAQDSVPRECGGRVEPVWIFRGDTQGMPFTVLIKHQQGKTRQPDAGLRAHVPRRRNRSQGA